MVAAGRQVGKTYIPRLNYRAEIDYGGVEAGDSDGVELKAGHFVKVDVEGMEQEVLEGARKTIERFQPLLWVENDGVEKAKELVERALEIRAPRCTPEDPLPPATSV